MENLFCSECGCTLSPGERTCPECGTILKFANTYIQETIVSDIESRANVNEHTYKNTIKPETTNNKVIYIGIATVVLLLAAGGYFFFLKDKIRLKPETVQIETTETIDDNRVKNSQNEYLNENKKETIEKKETPLNETRIETVGYIAKSKAFFYDEPSEDTMRKAYLAEGDVTEINEARNGFAYTIFTNTRGQTTKGWIKMSDLYKNSLIGEWRCTFIDDDFGEISYDLILEANNHAIYKPCYDCSFGGNYTVKDNTVYFKGKDISDNGDGNITVNVKFFIKENTLISEDGSVYKRN